MPILFDSLFSTTTWIGFIVAALVGMFFTLLFNTITKPFKKKEFGLRCDEVEFSSSALDLLSGSNLTVENAAKTEKQVFVKITLRVSNTGKNDIGKSDIYKQLKIWLPKPFKAVSVSTAKKNNKMFLKNIICDNCSSIVSEWDLLKKGNSFDLTIVANAPKDENSVAMMDAFYDSIEIEIFANGIDTVNKSQSKRAQSRLVGKLAFLLSLFFLGLLLLTESKDTTEPSPFRFDVQTEIPANTQRPKQELLNCKLYYEPKTNIITLQNDSTTIVIPINELESQIRVDNISVDTKTISIIHGHWIQRRIIMIVALVMIISSLLLTIVCIVYNYFKNVK